MLPGICIGMLSPLVLAQYANEQKLEIGCASSKFYTAMTLGGLVGTFAAGFLLVPTFGSINLIFIMSATMGFLGLLSIVMLKRVKENESLFLTIAFFVVLAYMVNISIFSKQSTGFDFWVDTYYGRAHVIDSTDDERPVRSLMVSGGYESAMYLDDKDKSELVFGYLKSSAKITKNFLKEDDSARCLGGGAYYFPKYLASKQKVKVDVVEIDEGVTTLAREYFYLDEVSNNSKHKITNYTGDGRVVLPTLETDTYALVFNDTFAGEEPVATLSTLEATKDIKKVLKPNGFYMMNIIGSFDNASNEFLGWEVKTLREAFKSVRVFYSHDKDSYDSKTQQNWIVIATDNTKWKAPKSLYEVQPNLDDTKVLTDENCPVEYLTARQRILEE
jgi:predicted membrane-bound spermidine synthase